MNKKVDGPYFADPMFQFIVVKQARALSMTSPTWQTHSHKASLQGNKNLRDLVQKTSESAQWSWMLLLHDVLGL